MTAALLGFAFIFLLALLRVPLAFAMGLVGFAGIGLTRGLQPALASTAQVVYETGFAYTLSVIPLFILMGNFVARAGLAHELFQAAYAFIGHVRGGLAHATVAACAGFGAICGSSIATAATMSKVAYPSMRKLGYSDSLSTGVMAAGGTLGIMIPPSTIMVIYGIITETNIGKLFAAGVIPGLLTAAMLMLAIVVMTSRDPEHAPPGTRSSWPERWRALRGIWGVLVLVLVVLGGIYGGQFAASEAAAITTLYVLIVTVGIKREIKLTQLPQLMAEAMRLVGAILIILGAAGALSNWLVDQEVPNKLFDFSRAYVHSGGMFLMLLNLVLLLVGMFIDIFSAIVILTPLLVPVAVAYGIHPVHFGIVMLANLQIGYFMPPAGMDLFIAAYRFETGILTLAKACLPFFLLVGGALMVITWWPWLSLAFI